MTGCDRRMWGDDDGLRCNGEHHPTHTYTSTSANVGTNDRQHG